MYNGKKISSGVGIPKNKRNKYLNHNCKQFQWEKKKRPTEKVNLSIEKKIYRTSENKQSKKVHVKDRRRGWVTKEEWIQTAWNSHDDVKKAKMNSKWPQVNEGCQEQKKTCFVVFKIKRKWGGEGREITLSIAQWRWQNAICGHKEALLLNSYFVSQPSWIRILSRATLKNWHLRLTEYSGNIVLMW